MFFWLAIMLVLTLTDYSSREWFGPSKTDPVATGGGGGATPTRPAH